MGDRSLESGSEGQFAPEGSRLLDPSLDLSANALEQLKGATTALKSSKGLDGVLPSVDLVDSSDDTNMTKRAKQDIYLVDRQPNLDDLRTLSREDKIATQLKDTKFAQPEGSKDVLRVSSPPPLEEPGPVKERIPGNTKPGMPYDEVIYEDGTRRVLRPAGTIIEYRENMTIDARPDHTIYIEQDGKTRQVKPSHPERGVKSTKVDDTGIVTYEYKDGTQESLKPDGSRAELGKDRVGRYYDADGRFTGSHKNHSDNSMSDRDEKGRVTHTWHDNLGSRWFTYDEKGDLTKIEGTTGTWERKTETETGPDGKTTTKTYWQNKATSEKMDGNYKVDKNGHMYFKPNDPSKPTTVFPRYGGSHRLDPW